MDELNYKTSALGEFLLWGVLSLFLLLLGGFTMATAGKLLELSDKEILAATIFVASMSGVWGAWGAMIWTRSSAVRLVLLGIALVPGILMLGGGIWAFVTMPENRWVWRWGWLILAGHGLGAVVATLAIGSRGMIHKVSRAVRQRRLAMGWTLYPILLMAGNVAVMALLIGLVPEVLLRGDGFLHTLARWMIPAQGAVLLTTGLPAFWALICRAVTRDRQAKG